MKSPYTSVNATDIAIVAISCSFPGANSPEEFWELLKTESEGISTRTDADLVAAGVSPEQSTNANYVRKGSTMSSLTGVDLAAFGLGLAEATVMDPQHRILLEQSWLALDRAGHGHGAGIERVGVWAGASFPSYLHHHLHDSFDPLGGRDPVRSLQIALGNMPDYLATGIAYRLGLTGTAVTVQTACSSSLVAVHEACNALLLHEVDMAIAGGVTIHTPAGRGYEFIPDGPFSCDGKTASYGETASGAVFTEGAGMIALRRLTDALADGDPILSVIVGSAVNNDGDRKVGFTAPSPEAHAEVISEALAAAGISPREISYVEGHGTGTPLGDPMEARALRSVFEDSNQPWCTLGSVKSNIGHTEAAAGIAGLIKVVLTLQHEMIPASLHCTPQHPELGLEGSALRLATQSQPWPHNARARYAGVSSLGFGGTNCHVVIKEAPPQHKNSGERTTHMLPLSAASAESLDVLHDKFIAWIKRNPTQLENAEFTLRCGRKHWNFRRAIITDGKTIDSTSARNAQHSKVLWAFPGGGAQRIGMLESILRNDPKTTQLFDQLRTKFRAALNIDIAEICAPQLFNVPAQAADNPIIGLPALFSTSLILADCLRRDGWAPDAVIGHSAGEYVAAVVAGVLTLDEAIGIVAARSKALENLPAGGLLRLRCDATTALQLCADHPQCSIAAWNSPSSTVIAGPESNIRQLAEQLSTLAEIVPIKAPAHSHLVEPAIPAVIAAAKNITSRPASISWISSVTGDFVDHRDITPEYWGKHMREPVRFSQALSAALDSNTAETNRVIVVNVGPSSVLASLAREANDPRIVTTLSVSNDDGVPTPSDLLFTEGELFSQGAKRFDVAEHSHQRIVLPDYPFHRTQAWVPYRPLTTRNKAREEQNSPITLPICSLEECAVRAPRTTPTEWNAVEVRHFKTTKEVIQFCKQLPSASTSVTMICVIPENAIGAAAILAVAQHEHSDYTFLCVEIDEKTSLDTQMLTSWIYAAKQQYPQALRFRFRHNQCSVLAAVPRALQPSNQWPKNLVLIGGRGNIGTAIARAALAAGSQVIQTSRTTKDPTATGAHCVLLNPSDKTSLQTFLKGIEDPKETAVIVCTGLVGFAAFEPLKSTNAEEFWAHKEAKTDVTKNLIDAISELGKCAPASLVVFSSLAAHIGGVGLGAYAKANAEAEAIIVEAVSRRACPYTKLLAIASDGWQLHHDDSEFANRLLQHSLEPSEALTSIITLLEHPTPPVVMMTHSATRVHNNRANTELPSPHALTQQSEKSDAPKRVTPNRSDSSTSSILREIWQEVLDVSITTDDADFFQLGGSSLLATRMLVLIEERTGIRLRLRNILQHSNIRALSDQLAAKIVVAKSPAPENPETKSATDSTSGFQSDKTAPLTDVQRAYLIGRTSDFGDGSASCHSFVEYLTDRIDIDRFQHAFNKVISRHPMLRTVATLDGLQEVPVPPQSYIVDFHDIRNNAAENEEIVKWRNQWSRRPARADLWPLVDVSVLRASDGDHIGWSIDVLVCDASSFDILVTEVGKIYQGDTLPPAPTNRFSTYTDSLWDERNGAASTRRREAAEYWKSRVVQLPPAPNIRSATGNKGEFRRRTIHLGPQVSLAIKEFAKLHATTTSAVLLAAYRTLLARWSGDQEFTVMVTFFDRPEDYRGVIGDFTTVIPCQLHANDDISTVSAQLFDTMDHRAVSGVEILAQRSTLDKTRFLLPVVFTSMLGSSLRDTSWCGKICYGISQTPQVILDHQVYEGDDGIVAQFDALNSAIDLQALDTNLEQYRDIVLETCRHDSPSQDSRVHDCQHAAVPNIPNALESVRSCWAKALHRSSLEIPDDATFISLGGDSITAVRALGLLRKAGFTVKLEDLLGTITPRDINCDDVPNAHGEIQLVRANDGEPFPLTPLQQAYWIGTQGGWSHSHGSAHFYVDYFDSLCNGVNLKNALSKLILHQPMLRAKILPNGTQVIVDSESPEIQNPPVEIIDLSMENSDTISSKITEMRMEWCTAPIDPEQWPPYRCRALLLPNGGARVAVQSSLAFVDGWSFYLFFEQLLTLQDNPNTVFPSPSISFADYALTLHELSKDDQTARDRAWWAQRLPELPSAPNLPANNNANAAGMSRKNLRYAADYYQQLVSQCRTANVTPSSVFFAAYAFALSVASEQREMLLSSLYFNRLPLAPDVDRVLGPFATTTLVPINTGDLFKESCTADSLVTLAQRLTANLSESLQHSRVSGIEISRLAAHASGEGGVLAPVVFTSTLGFSDSASTQVTARIDASNVYERVVTPQVLMDCQVAAEGHEVVLNLDTPAGAFSSKFTDAMIKTIDSAVHAFITQREVPATVISALQESAAHERKINCKSAPSNVEAVTPTGNIGSISHETKQILMKIFKLHGSQINNDTQLSFFAAGGDSLGMIRALQSIRKRFEVQLTPSEFLDTPTVHGIGSKIEALQHDATPTEIRLCARNDLIKLTDAQQEPSAVCYLVHPSGGDVLCYLDLAREMTDINVVAIPDPDLTSKQPQAAVPTAISELCGLYADLIIQHQKQSSPTLPFYVGGWSMGGTVAQEIVQQLAEADYFASGLILIDSNSPDRIRHITGICEEDARTEYARRYVASIEAFTANGADDVRDPSLGSANEITGFLDSRGHNSSDAHRKLTVFTRHLEGLAAWNARSCIEIPTLLLIADKQSPVNSRIAMGVDDASDSPTLGWNDKLPGNTKIVRVAAHHYSILREPALNHVWRTISEFIENTITRKAT